jgi:hypothetical protein
MFYALLIPLPILLAPQPQIWTILVITLLMNVSGTMAAVMGKAFFAETVPVEWRGQVVGTRNARRPSTAPRLVQHRGQHRGQRRGQRRGSALRFDCIADFRRTGIIWNHAPCNWAAFRGRAGNYPLGLIYPGEWCIINSEKQIGPR